MKKPRAIAVRSEDGIVRLIYTTDTMPGYRRHRRGTGFSFLLPDGKTLADRTERRRILSLAVPPAYESVWICMRPDGHLQATGIDARGRKQYRYHPHWHAGSADRKFGLLPAFAAALPRIRQQVVKALSQPALTRERVIAGIVALLDSTGYRIGNSRYEKENHTFGLSNLLGRHLREVDGQLTMKFRGKAGQEHLAEISNPRLVRLVSELQELPGQHLFRHEDRHGEWHDIGTADVNEWLKEISGGDYTAKQFRTWKATVLCARELAREQTPDAPTARERVIRQAITDTAVQLHHTPATCRKYYIHPALLTAYRSGELYKIMRGRPPRLRRADGTAGLRSDERRIYKIVAGTLRKS
ncbi:MAG: DNA topoisomerase IB [Verrucomicrobiaceae bacterium]|nr:MAG: DNA topoisomerase IB [Verrucomicrobiaceae bacterium]